MNIENFDNFSDAEIISHIATLDLGEQIPPDYLAGLLVSVGDSSAIIERREYGYAVVLPMQLRDVLTDGRHCRLKRVVLEIIYVSDQCQSSGFGTRFLSELASKYNERPMYAVCVTKKRRDFFIKRGFVLVEKLDDDVYQLDYHPRRPDI